MKNEGTFRWVDGTNIAITPNWRSEAGEPNNWRDNEDCVESTWDGKWNDNGCFRLFGFICERGLSNDKKYLMFMLIYILVEGWRGGGRNNENSYLSILTYERYGNLK